MNPLLRWSLFLGVRRDLRAGAPERAMERLDDPRLASHPRARDLKFEVVDGLCRAAQERARAGRPDSVVRLLGLVEREDPERAAHWRARLVGPADPEERAAAAAESLEDLLLRMRREARAGAASSSHGLPPAAADAPEPAAPHVLRLGIDDGGEYLLVVGDTAVWGHRRSGLADLPFLADVAARHARLSYGGLSFHGGSEWRVEPIAEQRLLVNARVVEGRAVQLRDGDAVSLAPNLTFLFHLPDATSSAAVCELATEGDCLGARRILLLAAPGSAGRVRVGAGRGAAVRLERAAQDVALERTDGGLAIRSAAGVQPASPTARAVEPPGAHVELQPEAPVELPPETHVELPLRGRVDLRVGRPEVGRPPFGIFLAPLP